MFVFVSGKQRVGLCSTRPLDGWEERGGLMVLLVLPCLGLFFANYFVSNSDYARRRR